MSIQAKRIVSGSYKAMDSLERMWYIRKVPENPVDSRWELTNDFEDVTYTYEMKSDALVYIEVSESSKEEPKLEVLKGAMTKEELLNFDCSNPENFWPDS